MFIAALFTIVRTWKQLRYPSTDEQIKKDVVYIYNAILLSHKKKKEWIWVSSNGVDETTACSSQKEKHMWYINAYICIYIYEI